MSDHPNPESAPFWDDASARPEAQAAADVPRAFAPAPGTRYEPVAALPRGGMGRVVVARDAVLGRSVALKDVPDGVDADVLRARLVREAHVVARLEHPGVVPIHDAGNGPDGTPYFVMRLVRGRSLAQVFAENTSLSGRLPYLRHLRAACEAVAYAHSQGVIHRDLKPANILVGFF